MRPVVPSKANSKLEKINPNVMYLNFTTNSWLRSRYKNPPGVIKIAKAIPTLSHKFALSHMGQGVNHKSSHPKVRNRIQMTVLPDRSMFADFLKNCVIDV